jgi:hypothetical protein
VAPGAGGRCCGSAAQRDTQLALLAVEILREFGCYLESFNVVWRPSLRKTAFSLCEDLWLQVGVR